MHPIFFSTVFYVLALLAVVSAAMVVVQKNPVKSVLFLVLAFFASAGLWLLLQAEFLAIILVLVYVGAVMTLFLFVVMMLNVDFESQKTSFLRFLPFGLVILAMLTTLAYLSIPTDFFTQAELNSAIPGIDNVASVSNTKAIGLVLYTDYLLAFEVAAAILLVAIIAAITLTHREHKRSKTQDIKKQLMTSKSERLSIVSISPQTKE